MRAQYHLRNSERGLLAWDVRRLTARASGLAVEEVPLAEIRELDEGYWFDDGSEVATCRAVAEHARLIEEADLRYPILLDPQGRVLDGMHRVCKALLAGWKTVPARRLRELPEPDFIGVAAEELPYLD